MAIVVPRRSWREISRGKTGKGRIENIADVPTTRTALVPVASSNQNRLQPLKVPPFVPIS